MAGFRERAEAELKGTTVEAIQAQNSAKSNKSFRERAQAELSKSSQQANTVYRAQQRRQTQQDEQQRKQQEEQRKKQVSSQMQKLNRQTNLQRVDTGESENDIGTKNYLSYRGTDPREIPVKQRVQNQIDKAKQEAMEKQAAKTHSRNLGDTILDIANQGAGQGFVTGVADTADFLANLVPNAAAKIRGEENPEHTFTGQLLKPLTDATQKFSDWTHAETNASAQRVQEDTKDSKVAQLAAEIGSGVVGAIPNAVLAMMTAGGSAASTLAPQTTGLSGTAANAVQKVAQNPSFQVSYLQTLGGAYQDAKAAGASEANATIAAFISAAANALVEVGGGIETLPGDLQAKDLSTFEQAKEWLTSALDEGKEEVVQGVISALTNKVAANSDTPYFSMNDQDAVINPARMGQEFGMGAAVGGILGGAELLGTKALNRINTQANANSNADASVEQNSNAEIDPLEFAIQETMKPTKEQQAFDQAMEDTANWMLGKEKTATAEAGTESDIPLLLPEQSELSKQRGYPYEKKDAVYKVVDIPQEKVLEIENYIDSVDNATAKKHFKKVLKNLFSGQEFTNANTVANEVAYKIGISSKGIGEIIARQPVNAQTLAMLEQLNEIVENAKYIASEPTSHENRRGVSRTDIFETDTKIGEQPGTARMRVNVTKDGNKLYFATNKDAVTMPPQPWAGNNRLHGVEEAFDASNITIPKSNQNVNQNQGTNFDNDMGAKKSDFEHEVKQSKSKTTPDFYEKHNVPDGSRTTNEYTAVTEVESLHNAKMRLEQDYDGEMMELRSKPVWTNEEVDMGQMILEDLWYESTEIGDDSAFRDWDKVVKQHKQEIPRALQAMAKWNRNSGAGIVSAAIDILDGENTRNKVDTDAVMHTISDAAKQFDAARMSKDVDGLVQLIKDTAGERNTAYRKRKDGSQQQSKYLNWALNRIAKYAKSGELTGNVNANLEINAANIQNPDVAFKFLQDFASTGILNIAADTQKVSKETQLMALRRSGMLSKVSTVMRNLVSNGVFDIADTMARDISVPLDMVLSTFTGTRSVSADYGYLSKAKRQGTMDGIAMASLETSLDVNGRDNSGKYTAGGQRTFKMSGNPVDRFFSRLEALQGYALYVTDEMSKGGTSAEVQRGTNKLYEKNKIKASDASLRDAGAQEALYRTFQDETALSNAMLTARKAGNDLWNSSYVGGNGDIGLGDVALTFAQVPTNLVDRGIDYSPVGVAKTTGKLIDAISKAKKGQFTAAEQAKVVQSLGRNITGSLMIAALTPLALGGAIKVVNPGDEDENADKSAFEKMQGQNGTQVNLSAAKRLLEGKSGDWEDGDDLVSIAYLDPFNAHLTVAALLAESLEEDGELTKADLLKKSFGGVYESIKDLPMLNTFNDVSDAFKYSDQEYGYEKLLDAGKTLVANEAASLIPNWMKGIRQGLDPYQRDLYTEDDTWEQLKDQYQAVFGKRSELPIKQDSFGRDMMNEGGVKNFLNANILPGYMTTYKTDATMDEIARLAEETGNNSIYPSRKAPDELSIDGTKVPLSSDEQKQYQKVYGNADEAIRTGLMESEAYSKLSSEEQFKAHQYSEDYAKQVAASTVNGDYDTDDWVKELQGKSEAEIVETVLYKTFESLAKDKKYSSKYEGMADLVDQDKLSDAMAITMMPDKMQTAYQNVAQAGGVSVDEWLDLYAYAYPYGKTESGNVNNEKIRDNALDYISKQNWGDDKKTAAANAIFQFLTDTIPLERDVPYNWALDQGDAGLALVESGMSKTQKQNYEKYVKGHFDNDKLKLYLDAYAFKGTAKNIYEEDGKTVKYSAKDQVIDHIDSLDLDKHEKIRFFLGLDYSEKSIPSWWY